MITISIQVRRRDGQPVEGKRVEKTFANGSQAQQWYDAQPGHNTAHDQYLASKMLGLEGQNALDIQ